MRVEVTAAFDMVHQNQLMASRMNIRNHSWACEKTSATSSSGLSSQHSQLVFSQGRFRSTGSFGGMDNDYSSSPVADVNEGLSLSYSLSPVNEELSLSSSESPIPGRCGRCTFQNSTSALVCSVCNTNLVQPNGSIDEILCRSCTLLNSASNANCTMCGSTLQEFSTLARPSRPLCAGPRQGPINSDNVNRGKNQHTTGSEILRGIPQPSSTTIPLTACTSFQQLDDALTQRAANSSQYPLERTAEELDAGWRGIASKFRFPGSPNQFVDAVNNQTQGPIARKYLSELSQLLNFRATAILHGTDKQHAIPAVREAHANLVSTSHMVGYLGRNDASESQGNLHQQQVQNIVLGHVAQLAQESSQYGADVRAAHKECSRLDPDVVAELGEVVETPSITGVGSSKVPSSNPAPPTASSIYSLTWGDMYIPELSGLMIASGTAVWWVIGGVEGWINLTPRLFPTLARGVVVLKKIGVRSEVETAVKEAREKGELADGCLAGAPVRVLRSILFRLQNLQTYETLEQMDIILYLLNDCFRTSLAFASYKILGYSHH